MTPEQKDLLLKDLCMKKFLLELELRYREVKDGNDHYRTPKIVIGIYDSWDEAEKVSHLRRGINRGRCSEWRKGKFTNYENWIT